MNSKPSKTGSIRDLIGSSEPITHFFYEREGECVAPARLLAEDAITLWHEAVFTNEVYDNSYLWEEARTILENRGETPIHSWVEWARYNITMGTYVPKQWGNRRPYPYKGLLISAIYLQEARRLCEEDESERAWHLIALAYYHLGLNTTRTTVQNVSRAAQVMHAGRTEKIRVVVLHILKKIEADGTAKSISAAKDQVVDLIRRREDKLKPWLNEFDVLVPEKTKGRSDTSVKNDVFVRIRNMLDNWALPSGPYPEIAEAFSHFSKKKSRSSTQVAIERSTAEEIPIEEVGYYLRLISHMEEGSLTVKLSSNGEEEAANP